ncbi:MAG: MFS transporter [Chloroflexi bacterium]|nr:MFS transporter [Chloroflexota bacterium]MCH8064802.1 MFS transporter [Chloroflexota bacterium]
MVQPEAEIPRRNRIIYASASLGGNVLSRTTTLWLLFFYAPPADADMPTIVPRFTLAIILLLVGIQDAINDPIIGHWSDRTRTRWGRRIPFVVLSTPFYALFFFLFFTPPGVDHSIFVNALYITAIVLIQRIVGTMSSGPIEALLPEIAQSSAARVSIVAWQVFLGALGAAFALVATGVIKDAFGWQVMAGIVAIIALVSRYIGLWGAWPYARRNIEPVRIGLITSLRQVFRNDQFLYFLPTFVLFNTAVTMLLATLPFFAESVILGDDESLSLSVFGLSFDLEGGAVSSILAGAAILAVIVFLPAIYRLTVSRGKAWVYSAAMLFAALTFPLLFLMGLIPGVDPLIQSIFFVALAGIAITGVFAFPNAIMADIIDYDALRTGMRREALYYGAQNTIEKGVGSLAVAILAGLFLLGETAADPLGLRLVGPVAGAAAFIGFIIFIRGYRLPDTVTAETVREKGLI